MSMVDTREGLDIPKKELGGKMRKMRLPLVSAPDRQGDIDIAFGDNSLRIAIPSANKPRRVPRR